MIGCVGAVVVFRCVRFFKVRKGVLAIVQTSDLRRCARPLPSTRRSRCVVASLSAGCRAIFQSCGGSLCGGNSGCSVIGLIVFSFYSGDACRDVCSPNLADVAPMPSARLLPQRGSCLVSAFVPPWKDLRFQDHS